MYLSLPLTHIYSKLSRNERLISPASQLAELGRPHSHLLDAIEAALKFQNVEGDDESVELAKILKEMDAEAATEKITSLEPSHPLFKDVVARVKKVQEGSK
jgi:mannitol-1-phosphate 5-dehydrogenase